jgi:hypothetical protein
MLLRAAPTEAFQHKIVGSWLGTGTLGQVAIAFVHHGVSILD